MDSPTRTAPARALALACAALVTAGVGRGIYQHTVVDAREHPTGPEDARYRALRDALPADGRLQYVTDVPQDPARFLAGNLPPRAEFAVRPGRR